MRLSLDDIPVTVAAFWWGTILTCVIVAAIQILAAFLRARERRDD